MGVLMQECLVTSRLTSVGLATLFLQATGENFSIAKAAKGSLTINEVEGERPFGTYINIRTATGQERHWGFGILPSVEGSNWTLICALDNSIS